MRYVSWSEFLFSQELSQRYWEIVPGFQYKMSWRLHSSQRGVEIVRPAFPSIWEVKSRWAGSFNETLACCTCRYSGVPHWSAGTKKASLWLARLHHILVSVDDKDEHIHSIRWLKKDEVHEKEREMCVDL